MTQSDNPYQTTPGAVDDNSFGSDAPAGNTQTQLLLQQTRPWVLTMGIVMIIGGALGVLGGIGMAVIGLFAGVGAATGPAEAGVLAGMAVVYGVMGLIYLIPASYLIKYSRRITDYLGKPTHDNLNAALTAQKSFWKFVGIAFFAIMAVYVLVIIAAVIFGIVARV